MKHGRKFFTVAKNPLRLLTALILLVLCSSSSLAQTTPAPAKVTFSISPVTFELTANPGQTLTQVVKVMSLSEEATSYTMEVESFIGNETGQATIVDDDPHPELALKDWTTATPAKFSLAAKAQQLVTVTIRIPKDAEPGGRYGSVLAMSDDLSGAVDGTGAKVRQKVGTLVLLSVFGPINYQANIKDFAPAKPLFEHGPATLSTRIHNSSTVHIKPKGFITLTNLFGKKVAQIPFEERNVLPNNDRLLETKTDKKLGLGRYTANLALIYGDKNEQLLATTNFIVFPWKTGVPIILAILAILWFVIARRQRLRQALRVLIGKS